MAQSSKIRKSKEIDFTDSFRPFYYFARIFGYLPFTISYDSNDSMYRPVVGAFDIVWFIISLCLHIFVVIVLLPITHISYASSSISNDSSRLMLIVSLSFGILIIAMDMLHRFKFVDIFNKFNRIDDAVC